MNNNIAGHWQTVIDSDLPLPIEAGRLVAEFLHHFAGELNILGADLREENQAMFHAMAAINTLMANELNHCPHTDPEVINTAWNAVIDHSYAIETLIQQLNPNPEK